MAGVTTLTVKNNSGFILNDFVLIGNIGDERAEIKRISAAVIMGSSLTIIATSFAHDRDTPVIKCDYDQVAFYHSATTTAPPEGSFITNSRIPINPTEEYTYFNDNINTTGFGFTRYYDATALTYSVPSIAVPYTGYTKRMLRQMRKKVRRLINEPDESIVSDEEIDDELNLAQTELGQSRMWSVLEDTKSLSTVANQYEYNLASSVFVLFNSKFNSQPLGVITLHGWNLLRWNADTTGNPTHICMWGRRAKVYPYPSSSANTTTLTGDHTAIITTITVASTSNFREQGRIIIGSEIISYTGKTPTTLTGCSRREEGTTATTHLNGAIVTERDIIYHYQKDPDDLEEETSETPFLNPNAIIYKASSELAQDEITKDKMLIKYERAIKLLEKSDESKYKSAFGRVRNALDYGVRDPNRFPTGLTGT